MVDGFVLVVLGVTMEASVEIYSETFEVIKTITKSFPTYDDARNWILHFKSDKYIGWVHDGTFAINSGVF